MSTLDGLSNLMAVYKIRMENTPAVLDCTGKYQIHVLYSRVCMVFLTLLGRFDFQSQLYIIYTAI